ncbi:hypothetical protein [Yersinia pseudotuberculosis]|uniref:hypothetical protein n=1 Tax=Yersinia pseudotuberculosis TaxID=633 RepID=UPI0005DACA27|nr:hypothetical protein [Yersinia pseudotuberculosis]CND35710.1 Uncharacterised protein [Yersinia pseudotuberculosis]
MALSQIDLLSIPITTISGSDSETFISLSVTGITRSEYAAEINSIFDGWHYSDTVAVFVEGIGIRIEKLERENVEWI